MAMAALGIYGTKNMLRHKCPIISYYDIIGYCFDYEHNNNNNNNNNNICLKSNIQTSSVDYAPRELTHACSRSETCSRSDTEACDMCYVF